MPWALYRLRFQLLSGLHSGSFPTGNILKTRSYITGRAMWGTTVVALVGRGLRSRNARGFEEVGALVCEHLRFGYFFPFAEGEVLDLGSNGCLGGFGTSAAGAGRGQRDRFEYAFLDTYSSTALNYDRGSAETSSLHEIEYIRPQTRASIDTNAKQVIMVGSIAVREGEYVRATKEDVSFFGVSLRDALGNIQTGGKRKYGFGRMKLMDNSMVPANDIFGVFFGADDCSVRLPARAAAPAHIEAQDTGSDLEAGKLEPLIGREWRESKGYGAGQYITHARLCWGPGALFAGDLPCTIDPFGFWQISA